MSLIDTIENYGRALTAEELSKFTTISTKTLYRLVKQRRLPALRIGGSIRFEPKTTADWLRSRLS